MHIRSNMMAINSMNNLNKAEKKSNTSLNKLSTGLRITKAADDAAGLSISEKMRALIRGFGQAKRNIQDGVSYMNVADGGLANIQAPPLQRLRELAIEAANDTLTHQDRKMLQQEVDSILLEIEQIVKGTEFNTRPAIKNEYVQMAMVTGDIDISDGLSIVAGVNDRLQFKVDNETVKITFDAGNYSADDFTYMLNDKLWDVDPLLKGQLTDGKLSLIAYGKDKIEEFSGNGVALMYDYHIGSSGGLLYGASILDGDLEITDINNTLSFSLDGVKKIIDLNFGKYDQENLIDHINEKLSGLPVQAVLHGENIWLEAPGHFIDELSGDMVEINAVTSPLMDNILKGYNTAASVTGQVNLSSGATITPSNNELSFDVTDDYGVTSTKTIQISEGVYNNLNSIVDELNEQLKAENINVTATTSGNKLKFAQNIAGSDYNLENFHGSAMDTLLRSYSPVLPSTRESYAIVANPSIIGARNLLGGIVLDAEHNTLGFYYDGYEVDLTLDPASYTKDSLLEEIQTKIDLTIGNPKISGSKDLKNGLINISEADNALSFEFERASYTCELSTGIYNIEELVIELQEKIDSTLNAVGPPSGSIKVSTEEGMIKLSSEDSYIENLSGTATDLLFSTYAENVTDGSSQILGSRDLSQGLFTIIDSNLDLSFTYNDNPYSITLEAGYYSPDELLNKLQDKLDASVEEGKISVTFENGHLTMTNHEMGNLDITGGDAVELLFGTHSQTATDPGKVVAIDGNGYLTLTNIDIDGRLDRLSGTAADKLFNYHYIQSTKPTSNSSDPFTGEGKTDSYTVEGFAAKRYNHYAAKITGAVNLSSGLTIGDTNNTMHLKVTTNAEEASYDIKLDNDSYTSDELLSAIQDKLSGMGIKASYSSSRYLVLEHITAGADNSFTVTNSSLGKELLEMNAEETKNYYYLVGGNNNYYATYTGTKPLSAGINTSIPNTLRLSRDDGETWQAIELPAGDYESVEEIINRLNQAFTGNGINDVIASIQYNRLQLTYKPEPEDFVEGQTLTIDSTCDAYKLLFENLIPHDPIESGGYETTTQAVGKRDISGGVYLTEDNNVLTFSIDETRYKVVLETGYYNLMNSTGLNKLNEQLRNNNVKASLDNNHLVLTHDTHQVGTHLIDSIGGSASYKLFYNGSDNVSASYIKGQLDLSAGVAIIPGDNDLLTFDLDGEPKELVLTEGTYTKEQLVGELQGQFDSGAIDMTVSLTDENRIIFKHNRNGTHTIVKVGGSAANTIFYNDKGSKHDDDNLRLQVGANSGQSFRVKPPRINLEVLGIEELKITDHKTAEQSIRKIDHAILVTSNEQSRIGAYQNALEHLASNVGNEEENMISAETRIRSVDMAKEVMILQRNKILAHAAQAILAQANQEPSSVLELINN